MFCPACTDSFSAPRRLAYGTYYPWKQTPATFAAALAAGCHLCHLVDECRTYKQPVDGLPPAFPSETSYAFKALNDRWTREGKGQQWMAPQLAGSRGDDDDVAADARELAEYLRLSDADPTPNGLGALLATDDDRVPEEAAKCWPVLEFYGPAALLALPIELATGRYAALAASRQGWRWSG